MTTTAEITETRRGTTIDITIVADTYADAFDARNDYYSRWPAGGYSTSLGDPRLAGVHHGAWVVTGHRGNSS